MTAPLIDVAGLSVSRGNPILRDVRWRVMPGEHWAVLGANGSGKTSLISALAGFTTPDVGRVAVLGRVYGKTDWRDLRRFLGLVSAGLRQRVEGRESVLETVVSGAYSQINFWGTMTPVDRARAMDILKKVECAPLASRSWATLSEGEKQRVFIGRALMGRPRMLLLDEPCAGLDPAARETFLAFLSRLARRPKAPALVLVTHHVEEITAVFSHVLILKGGRVAAAGPKEKTLTSKTLSAAFGASAALTEEAGRYRLKIRPASGNIA